MAKMSDDKLDKLFEKMSRDTANKMNGTHPPVKKKATKKTAKKTVKRGKK